MIEERLGQVGRIEKSATVSVLDGNQISQFVAHIIVSNTDAYFGHKKDKPLAGYLHSSYFTPVKTYCDQ